MRKIDHCKKKGFYLEALVNNYHLNVDILRLISDKYTKENEAEKIKAKRMLANLLNAVNDQPALKSTINRRNLKTVKPWFSKMDGFFKTIKVQPPSNTKTLLTEGEKIFAILQISATKIFSGDKS
ncbi:MAG: hypothetical protein K0S12_1658 [Bacteroidetes bacterium]|nr:hypothetical protein [Bacteroidota bacterium]